MNASSERYDRQVRLAEVGVAGQERICRSVVEARGADGADVERTYLVRAGVRTVTDGASEPRPFVHEGVFRFAETRSVGRGAWSALVSLRAALEP